MIVLSFANLKYFYDAVKLGGVSAAAKANYVTQSAISQAIVKLEKSLGVSLVAHHPNCFRVTPEGQMAYQYVQEMLLRTHEFKESLLNNHIGNLEFACIHSFAEAIIPQYLKQFKAAHPDVDVSFYLGQNAEMKHMLKTGLIDFGIWPDVGEVQGFEKRTIYTGNFGLYVASSLKKSAVSSLGFIVADSECKDTAVFKAHFCNKYGKGLPVCMEVGSWTAIANLTAEGLGIGYFPDYIAKKKKNLLRPYDVGLMPLPYHIAAFFPKGMKLRKSSEIFLSYFG